MRLALLFKRSDIANFTDDITFKSTVETQEYIIERLRNSPPSLFKWFSNNYMKVNSGKCYLVISRTQRVIAKIDNNELDP